MARYSSSDHIVSEGENINRLEAIAEYRREHGDPRKNYEATYLVCGRPMTERVTAMTQQQAVDIVKYTCSLVGWQPNSLEVRDVEG